MKRLTKIVPGLALLALLFATPAAAMEIIMTCTYDTGLDELKARHRTYILKYSDSGKGKPKVFVKLGKGWKNWSHPNGKGWVVTRYHVRDDMADPKRFIPRSVFKEEYYELVAKKDYPLNNLKKGDLYRGWSVFEVTFMDPDFGTMERELFQTHTSGRPLLKGEEAFDPDKPIKHIYICGRVDPK